MSNTASGICNSTIKRQRSRSMNGQYFWLIDQVNLNFAAVHHRAVRPFYVHMQNSPREIRKVDRTVSARLRGCVDVPARPCAHLWSGRRPDRTSDGTIAELAPRVTRHANVRTPSDLPFLFRAVSSAYEHKMV